MPLSMHSLVQRLKRDGGDQEKEPQHPEPDPPAKRSRAPARHAPDDPNIPRKRLHVNQECLYERRLPGKAYVSAHVNRLQHGYYRSSVLHEPAIYHVYFVSVHFVFHPHDPDAHRFKSAEIEVCMHSGDEASGSHKRPGRSHPRILKHAPQLMFGAVSPENLQWNFSLSSSLGVSQAPVSASVNPRAAMQSSYKVFHMMSIQGSVRSRQGPDGGTQNFEDSKAVWTLTENVLQRSGLPREFDFVLLVQKPKDVKNMYMTVNVKANVGAWYGSYPQWYNNLAEYMPSQNCAISFDHDIGQRFVPSQPGLGYNFANLMHALDQYVMMPGTVYPTTGTSQGESNPNHIDHHANDDNKSVESDHAHSYPRHAPQSPRENQSPTRSSGQRERRVWAPENVNVRVVVDHRFPPSPELRRFSYSPSRGPEPRRHPSIRRRKSRTRLKECGETGLGRLSPR
ncbi:hypothetical protein ACJQWK_03232 [Exserohilum turcicum]